MGDAESFDEGFVLEMCSGQTSWQIEPSTPRTIDLDDVAEKIIAAGWEAKIQTRLCHIFEGEAKLTLFPSGKLMVKCEEKEMVLNIARMHLSQWLAEE